MTMLIPARGLAVLLAALLPAACGPELTAPSASSITITPGDTTLTAIGDIVRLSATAKDAAGLMVSVEVTWASSSRQVAIVSGEGLVTAEGNGTTTITASGGGASGSITITVSQHLNSVAVQSPVPGFATLGRTAQLTAAGMDRNDNPIPAVTFTWESSSDQVVTVNETGLVTAVANGTATITATSDTLSDSVDLTVDQLPVTLAFIRQPDHTALGAMLDTVLVQVRDSGGSRVTDATSTVTLALGTDPRAATLGGTTTVSADTGVAAFRDLTIGLAAVGYTLAATATGLASATSEPFGVFLPFMAISASRSNTCGITTDSLAYCWGINDSGQVGDGTIGTSYPRPRAVGGGFKFAVVAAGWQHTCALTGSGDAYCWGSNSHGQLGGGNTGGSSTIPVAVTGGLEFESITAGWVHTCAVTTAGQAYCWGTNQAGNLGDGNIPTDSDVPIAVTGAHTFEMVEAVSHNTCGVTTDDAAYCWGQNSHGQVGIGTTGGTYGEPMLVSGGQAFAGASAGLLHSCGVTTDGSGFCWGSDMNGRLGDGAGVSDSNAPVLVAGGLAFSRISAGGEHTCALTTANDAYCWGAANNGAVGTGDAGTDPHQPAAVTGGYTFIRLDVGMNHTCAITDFGAALCWGADFDGQLGDGAPRSSYTTPRLVIEP